MLSNVQTIATLLGSAESEAAALGDTQPGAEHLLLAAAALDDSVAAFGVTPDAVRAAIRAVHARALGADIELAPSEPARGAYRGASSLNEVFQRVRTLSKGEQLTALHVLRAAARLFLFRFRTR